MSYYTKLKNIAIFIFVAGLALFSLFYLRIIPAIGNEVEFRFDKAFNYRMTEDVLKNGDVPLIDRLSTYPEGKNIKAFLPTGLYHVCAFFHKSINTFKEVLLSRSILFFCALCGSLIFIPMYLISRELYNNKWIALACGFLAGVVPAFLHRSLCYTYRYEILGTPLLFTSLLFFIKAFGVSSKKGIYTYSILSTIFMIFSLLAWRLSVLFLVVYFLVFLYIWLRKDKILKKWGIVFMIVLGISFIYLKFTPGFSGKNMAGNYLSFPKAAFQIVMHKIGVKQEFSDFTRLMYYNRELEGISLADIFSVRYFSFLGVFLFTYLVLYIKDKSRSIQKDIIFIFFLFYLILTFLFARNQTILGPLVGITIGESLVFVFSYKKKLIKYILIGLISIAVIKTGFDAYAMSITRKPYTKLRPNLKQTLYYLNRNLPKDAIILSYWSDGYPIQTYCGRPTLTDGLMESPEIVKRIIELSKIYYSFDEERLLNFCNRYGATHIVVPKMRKTAYAGYAAVSYKKYYVDIGGGQIVPTDLAKMTVLYKLMHDPDKVTKFSLLNSNSEFNVYKVK